MDTIPSSAETGIIGIRHLKRFWKKNLLRKSGKLQRNELQHEWPLDQGVLNACGAGLHPVISFLYQQEPSFSDFENWLLNECGGKIPEGSISSFNQAFDGIKTSKDSEPDVLSPSDLQHFAEHGFVVVRNAVSKEDADAAAQVVWEYLGADPADPSTWYKQAEGRSGIMIQLFHHPALERTRHSARLRKAFEQIWGPEHRLFVTTDRVSFNPPETERWKFSWPDLHWDVSLSQPIPMGLQGLLYLTDTSENQGAFNLLPGFHRNIGEWLKTVPPEIPPREFIRKRTDVHCIAASAGDAVIWHHALPHGSKPNSEKMPRIVQYINWQSLDREIQADWI